MTDAPLPIRLDEADFRILIAGGVVERDGARIILADIGYDRMIQALVAARTAARRGS